MVMEAAEEADGKNLLDMLCEIAQHLREARRPECPAPKRTREALSE
jgi:hypothetical protein